jgi:hypothetical protein
VSRVHAMWHDLGFLRQFARDGFFGSARRRFAIRHVSDSERKIRFRHLLERDFGRVTSGHPQWRTCRLR